MRNKWRRWMPGGRHGIARGVGIFGQPGRTDPALLAELLGTCEQLRSWTSTYEGFELENSSGDLPLLDRAIDRGAEISGGELDGPWRMGHLGSQVGLYLGTVIVGTVPGARWQLWPNGHPIVRLPSGRALDVVAIANDRVRNGSPLLAEAYADATAGPRR